MGTILIETLKASLKWLMLFSLIVASCKAQRSIIEKHDHQQASKTAKR